MPCCCFLPCVLPVTAVPPPPLIYQTPPERKNRFGALFFLLLYLSLLSLTSLPVWREDRRLFLSESMGGAYGHLPYFTSVRALLSLWLLRRMVAYITFAQGRGGVSVCQQLGTRLDV